MRSRVGSAAKNIVFVIAMPCVIALMHWRYFFPRSDHSDLQFQLTGEAIELSVIAGILARVYFGFAESRRSQLDLSASSKILGGIAFAAISIALGWREYFTLHQFSLGAGLDNLGFSLFMGFFMTAFGFYDRKTLRKPSKEEEKSVV
jgi:hypothetical protein